MVGITEITSEDGSNGDDPNKNSQEEENQNENPQQQVDNLGPNKKKVHNLRIPEDLPNEINEHILTFLERCEYSSLLCTSTAFRKIVTSSELFETRSRLGRTECVLYTFIRFPPFLLSRWFILHRRNNSLRLSMIGSLPPLIPGSAVVIIGHDMYIIGGCHVPYAPVRVVIVIDCRFHTWCYLPLMRRARNYAAAGVVDGKIYVIGGCIKQGGDWIEVFDVSNNSWGTVPVKNPNVASKAGVFSAYVVMENKIYILDGIFCLVYEPRQGTWKSYGLGSQQRYNWDSSSCVVDDMLYSIDPRDSSDDRIVVYDPRDVKWRPVRGLHKYELLSLVYPECRMANLGGRLVILGRIQSLYCRDYNQEKEIWCIVIALKRCEDGEIWGKVESTSRVLSCWMCPWIEHSRTVTLR